MAVEFRTLGTTDLRDTAGRVVSAVLRQPKRLALLAYLACARPRGFRTRDELVALLWPELDETHARAALRKTIHVLRTALGADVIEGRGDDELTLAPDRIHTDVEAFEAALTDGRPRNAVALFGGDFLHGFHADTSPAFERWLDAERTRLRQRAADAAAAVAVAEQAGGDLAEAARWARQALDLAPLDETVLRSLLLVLDAAGDRAGALDAYQAFAARMAAEFDVDPAPETAALVAAIRARSQSQLTFVEPVPEPEVVALPGRAPAPAGGGGRTAWRTRRWPVLAASLVTMAAAYALWPRRATAALDPDRVAIAPFQVFDSTMAPWGVGIVEFVSRGLDQTGGLRMVPPSVAVRAAPGTVDLGTAPAFGRATGAGLVLLGSLLARGGDSIRVDAVLVDARAGRRLGTIEVGGTRARVDLVVDSLTTAIVTALAAAGRVVPLPHSRLSTRSIPALRAFIAGETALRHGAWDSAQVAFREVVTLDSTFALGWLRFGLTTLYLDVEGGPGWGYLLRASVSGGLSHHDSLMVEAARGLAPFMSGRVPAGQGQAMADRAYQTALTLTREYPDDAESWYALGSIGENLFTLLPVGWDDVAAAYVRATVLDSTFVPAYPQAMRYTLGEGDTILGARLARRLLALHPAGPARGLPLLIASMFDPAVSPAQRERLLDSLPPEPLWRGWIRLWLLADPDERAVAVTRAMARHRPDDRYWYTNATIARRNLAAELAYRGHLREAFAEAGTDDSGWFSNLLPDLARFGVVPVAVADSAMRAWTRVPVPRPARHQVESAPFRSGRAWGWWWWAQRGDTATLAAEARAFGRFFPVLRAAVALARADTASALREFAAWRPGYNDDPHGMVEYARLLAAQGRARDALAALQRPFFSDWPLAARVTWRLDRAGLEEQLGERDAARADYEFVTDVWRDADPELAPHVARAREGLARLGGE